MRFSSQFFQMVGIYNCHKTDKNLKSMVLGDAVSEEKVCFLASLFAISERIVTLSRVITERLMTCDNCAYSLRDIF